MLSVVGKLLEAALARRLSALLDDRDSENERLLSTFQGGFRRGRRYIYTRRPPKTLKKRSVTPLNPPIPQISLNNHYDNNNNLNLPWGEGGGWAEGGCPVRDGRREQVNTNSTLHLCWTNLTRWCDCGAARSGTDGVLDLDSYVACVGGAHWGTATEVPVKFGHLLAACASLTRVPPAQARPAQPQPQRVHPHIRCARMASAFGISYVARVVRPAADGSAQATSQLIIVSATHRLWLTQGLHLRDVTCLSWVGICRSFSFTRLR